MELSGGTVAAREPGRSHDLEAVVIGAGPHGLSAAVHMGRAGVRAQVFGRPMGFWETMPAGMKLRSNRRATNMIEPAGPLSLDAYAHHSGQPLVTPVPLSYFLAYGRWVQATAVPDVDERQVVSVERAAGGFRIGLEDGEQLRAGRVIVAGGIGPFARQADGFDGLPEHAISHTGEHADLGRFRGQRVLVIGGGQSALECAALLHEGGAASVDVAVRRPEVVWLRGNSVYNRLGPLAPVVYAPTDVGPLWYSRLVSWPAIFRRLPREAQDQIAYRCIRPACSHFVRVRLGAVRLHLGVEVTATEPASAGTLRVALSDGSHHEVDHVMLGTGYDVDITRYRFLDAALLAQVRRAGGYPVLARGLESSVPGLHFVGAPAAWSFGPILRFVSGSWYAGRAVARAATSARRATR